jgi:Uma2 family endonuclease
MSTVNSLPGEMGPVVLPPTYTPEDLLALPDGDLYELVDGKLVEKPMSQESSWVGGKLLRLLGNVAEDDRQLGWVFGADCGYQCFPDAPKRVCKPDVSFVSRKKLPERRFSEGHVRIPPDLAVEVVSPNDISEEVEAKVEEYLAAGVTAVWVVFPRIRIVHVYRQGKNVTRLREQDTLSDEELLPGFRCVVRDLLPLPGEQPSGAMPGIIKS